MNEVLISWSSVGLDEVGQKEEEGGLSFPRYPFFAVLTSLSFSRYSFLDVLSFFASPPFPSFPFFAYGS